MCRFWLKHEICILSFMKKEEAMKNIKLKRSRSNLFFSEIELQRLGIWFENWLPRKNIQKLS